MRRFGTTGPVYPDKNYVVSRSAELDDFIARVKKGRYIVIFAPRQSGKTTLFQSAINLLTNQEQTYFPIPLNFEEFVNCNPSIFYKYLYEDICDEIKYVFERKGLTPSEKLTRFLENTQLTDAFSMVTFFHQLSGMFENKRFFIVIDEFEGIPQAVISDFLYALRHIYLSDEPRCPYSVGIVGVKSIAQLNYDRSISPFNIQDEFNLPNFTLEQVHELLQQYTEEVGQHFENDVIESIHIQTSGQPFLVNRLAQILTDEMDIPKTKTITMTHFTKAHNQLIHERNTNIDHLTTNIRRDRRFERILMRITAYDDGLPFNLRDDQISELATFGVIKQGEDGMCEIANPVYFYCIIQTFKPTINGLEENYLPEDTSDGFLDYLSKTGHIDMNALLDNFRDFIARSGFNILQVPDTPQESVGRHLLLAYLEQFVLLVGGFMHIEVQTGRGRIDLLITHKQRKYIVETKVWRGEVSYQKGLNQLASYLKSEGASEGYYVVFDHRTNPAPRTENHEIDGYNIRSYVIPVLQKRPSAVSFDEKSED